MRTHFECGLVFGLIVPVTVSLCGCFQSERVVSEGIQKTVDPEPTAKIDPPSIAASVSREDHIRQWRDCLRSLHQSKQEPFPGDWLESHPEAGQSFEQYLLKEPKPRIDGFSHILLVPIGTIHPVHDRIVKRTAEYLSANFSLPVKMTPSVDSDDFPDDVRRGETRGYGEQLLTKYILDKVLRPRRPADALAVLGMTTHDLWPGDGWNFVFGQASLSNRVGVWSLSRYGDPSVDEDAYQRTLQRTVKVALHETGHMVGLPHCTAYECGMNGSNHLEETDRQPMEFCPECQAKIWWTCRYDPIQRCQRLAELARKDGLHTLAGFWEAEADALAANSASP